ncbi:hypothetical protein AB6A40_005094 [Gnathostoma spinigerum]|uniref:Uncharacterized protein n=1 Tax=Gnathostoma spinigerum TaxID=75299 RepID=A0ABD6EFK5_9BILA
MDAWNRYSVANDVELNRFHAKHFLDCDTYVDLKTMVEMPGMVCTLFLFAESDILVTDCIEDVIKKVAVFIQTLQFVRCIQTNDSLKRTKLKVTPLAWQRLLYSGSVMPVEGELYDRHSKANKRLNADHNAGTTTCAGLQTLSSLYIQMCAKGTMNYEDIA